MKDANAANPHTIAGLIGQVLVLNTVLAEVVAMLNPEQKSKLRLRLEEATADIQPVDEFEPDCSEYQRQQFAEWIQALDQKH
jgi:hypothetical protein